MVQGIKKEVYLFKKKIRRVFVKTFHWSVLYVLLILLVGKRMLFYSTCINVLIITEHESNL